MAKELPESVATAAARSAPTQPKDKLDAMRKRMAEARDLQKEIEDAEAALSEKRGRLLKILGGGPERGELVDMMEELRVPGMTLDPEGNLPAYELELKNWYSASIPKDPEKRTAALEHIEKVWKMPDIIKHTFTVLYGKGDAKRAQKLATLLRKNKIEFANDMTVHSQTLAAEVRRRFASGKPLSPADMEKIGATAGRVVKMSPVRAT